jgi:hypothetical protein
VNELGKKRDELDEKLVMLNNDPPGRLEVEDYKNRIAATRPVVEPANKKRTRKEDTEQWPPRF